MVVTGPEKKNFDEKMKNCNDHISININRITILDSSCDSYFYLVL